MLRGTLENSESPAKVRSSQSRLLSRLWAARSFLGGMIAIALAVVGQDALLGGRATSVAGGYYALAITVMLATMLRPGRNASTSEAQVESLERIDAAFDRPVRVGGRKLFWLGFGSSLVLVGVASALVWARPSASQRLSALLWTLGLLLLFLTAHGARKDTGRRRFLPGPEGDAFAPGVPQPLRYEEMLIATAMLLLAVALRLTGLEHHPGIFGDEGERGLEARAILEGHRVPFFGYGWWGVPNLYFYAVAATMRIFGDGLLGLRMLSVLSGLAAVFFVYRTACLLWGPRAGILAGTFLAVSPLALQFSRLAGESTPTGALWAGGFFFLFRCLRFGRSRDVILSGILFGLSIYFYPSGKLVLGLLPAVIVYLVLMCRRRLAQGLLANLGLLVVAFLLTFLPYGTASFKDGWRAFTGRYQERSIFSGRNRGEAFARANLRYDPAWQGESTTESFVRHPLEWGRVLFRQMRRSLDVLYRTGDPTVFYSIREHGGSMLSPLMAALTVLGLAYATWNVGDYRFGLSSLWFWAGLLGPALTLDTPSVQRLTGAWPATMLFPAALLDRVIAASWPLGIRLARRWLAVPLLGLVAYTCSDGIREYFVHYRSLAPYGAATAQARYAQSLGEGYKVYQLGVGGKNEPDVFFGYASTRFLAQRVEGVEVTVFSNILPITDNGGKGVAFLIYPWNAEYLPTLRLFYPGGREEVVSSSDGEVRFTAYKLTAALVRGVQTLRATYTQPDGKAIERQEPNLGTSRGVNPAAPWRAPEGLLYPLAVKWEGTLVAPAYGKYAFALAGGANPNLWIDGRRIGQSRTTQAPTSRVELVLAKGLHDVRLIGSLRDLDARVAVTWAFGAEAAQPIEPRFLFRGRAGGLSGEVWVGGNREILSLPEIAPVVRRVDPLFGFLEARDDHSFGENPFAARWHGSIMIEKRGEYRFETRSNGPSKLIVDGRRVLFTPADGSSSGSIDLKPGTHSVDLLYEWKVGRAQLEFYWTPPAGVRQLVPPTALLPDRRSWQPEELQWTVTPHPP